MNIEQQLDLAKNIINMIEISQNRKCWKAEELTNVGTLYNSTKNFIKHLENISRPASP